MTGAIPSDGSVGHAAVQGFFSQIDNGRAWLIATAPAALHACFLQVSTVR
jgi:hypothetical protein